MNFNASIVLSIKIEVYLLYNRNLQTIKPHGNYYFEESCVWKENVLVVLPIELVNQMPEHISKIEFEHEIEEIIEVVVQNHIKCYENFADDKKIFKTAF
ncbi:MAG: hypothetical protein COC01_06765 [Bacteroidetes bacterium]|nr:MAG: hypothetical protein COC01_06765 [Bacteroidota bacterium]